MDIKKQKEVAEYVYSRLEIIDPYCILAGGAPRDWYFGTTANDLDFYYVSTASTIGACKGQLEKSFPGVEITMLMDKRGPHEDSLYKCMPNLVRIFEALIDGIKVQFIQLSDVGCYNSQFKVVTNMDVSICKIAYKAGKFKIHKDFKKTVASKIMFTKEGYSWSDKHGQKMIERFKDKFYAGTEQQVNERLVQIALKSLEEV